MVVSKRILVKNFIVLLLGWTLTEGTTSIVGNIESSLNSDQGLGTVSLSVTRGTQIFGCVIVGLALKVLGCKWTAVLSSALCIPYVAIHFYPVWGTMIPTSILQGIGNTLLGVARYVYLTKMAEEWAKHNRVERTSLTICFIAIFDSAFYLLLMFMNIGSSFALGKMSSSFHLDLFNVSEEAINACGYQYCNENLGTTFYPDSDDLANINSTVNGQLSRALPRSSVYRFVTFCLTAIVIGCLLLVLFLDPLMKLEIHELKDSQDSTIKRVKEAILLLKHPNMLLLLPLPIYSNTEASFNMADFSKAFSVCTYGMQYIGLVSASVDFTAPIATFFSGFLSNYALRPIPFVLAFIISGSIMVSMMFSQVWIGHFPSMLAISGVWGISKGILNSRVFAIFGVIFPDKPEVAYTACSFAFGVAGCIFFAVDNIVCVRNKVIALLSLLILASISYITLEVKVRQELPKKSSAYDDVSDESHYMPSHSSTT